ncbi:MAG: pyridoxamine 5'-phosphate oxidase family protein [Ilumatobacter sp.]
MSIPVELADLQAKTSEYTWAYLLTVRPDATPHLVSISPQWDGDRLLMSVSSGTARNSTAGNTVTLCYPPLDHDGYSLIVDGLASPVEAGDGGAVPESKQLIRFAPSGAVLHRSAAPGFANSATGCANDCVPID